MKKIILILFVVVSVVNAGKSQSSIRDSSFVIPHIDIVYSLQIPTGDLADRFGFFHTIGGAFYVKDRGGFIYGFDGQIQFGDQVKELTFENLLTSGNQIINSDGEFSSVIVSMRGMRFTGQFGKVFNVLSPNPNSGIKVLVGAGFWQHRIRIEDTQLKTPQLAFPYQKGYDRMTNGLVLTQFIGYQFFGERRLTNFYAGIEFSQGFTQNRRAYNFSDKSQDDRRRVDATYAFKVAWVLPIYKRAPREFYYD